MICIDRSGLSKLCQLNVVSLLLFYEYDRKRRLKKMIVKQGDEVKKSSV